MPCDLFVVFASFSSFFPYFFIPSFFSSICFSFMTFFRVLSFSVPPISPSLLLDYFPCLPPISSSLPSAFLLYSPPPPSESTSTHHIPQSLFITSVTFKHLSITIHCTTPPIIRLTVPPLSRVHLLASIAAMPVSLLTHCFSLQFAIL